MTKRTAYILGVESGMESVRLGDFTDDELQSVGALAEAAHEICDNKRQYADHPGYDFGREPNADALWDAFDYGEAVGIRRGIRERNWQKRFFGH